LNIESAAGASAGDGQPGSIEVALATYNSARFLPELLDSLFAQTDQDFTLLVADDGSADDTLEILELYSVANPGRMRIVARGRQPHGPAGNFGRLLEAASADYVMLCDHDDVWLPDKISMSLARIRAMVAAEPPGTPILVHTDLRVVNADLEIIYPSFFEFMKLQPGVNGVTRLLLSNVATGCTMVLNRALYERARPIPPQAIMHDHWVALVASALGAIGCMREATILYRLHEGNAIGVRRPSVASTFERIYQTLFSGALYRTILLYSRQAAALLARFGDEMRPGERRATEALAFMPASSPWRRYVLLRRGGLRVVGLVRNVALIIVVTRGRASSNPKGDAAAESGKGRGGDGDAGDGHPQGDRP
jgi:hypothetical protein